jgi:hypothetical protein
MAQNANLQNCAIELRVQREEDRALLQQQHRVIATSIRRISRQPHQLLGNAAAAANQVPNQQAPPAVNASLSPTPRSLYILWDEWEIGIGGRKAAKLFTPQERGIVKHKFHRRKVVWDVLRRLVNAGHTAQVACDMIYTVYGANQTVTTIINRIKQDTRNGMLHPTLMV